MTLGSQHSPLFALVQETLRKRILSGAYAQGERLVEGDLAEEMGVSRIPVREALRALAAAGLVRIEPRRGASVASLSPEHARDIVEVRATLEALNARLAAQPRNPSKWSTWTAPSATARTPANTATPPPWWSRIGSSTNCWAA